MNRRIARIFMRHNVFAAFALCLAVSIASSARAQVPSFVPMQGFITDDAGTPLDGEHQLVLNLFDSAEGGTELFGETHTVAIEGGYFSAQLGGQTPLDLSLFAVASEIWAQMTIDGEPLLPRIQLGSVPWAAAAEYAANASQLDGFAASQLQQRVADSCVGSRSIRAINADGTVVCRVDDDTTYTAGAGLILNATEFAVDPAAVQARVGATCAPGSAIRAIAADGSVDCEPMPSTVGPAEVDLPFGSARSINMLLADDVFGSYFAAGSPVPMPTDATCLITVSAQIRHMAGTGVPSGTTILLRPGFYSPDRGTVLELSMGMPRYLAIPPGAIHSETATIADSVSFEAGTEAAFGCSYTVGGRTGAASTADLEQLSVHCNVTWLCL